MNDNVIDTLVDAIDAATQGMVCELNRTGLDQQGVGSASYEMFKVIHIKLRKVIDEG